MVANGRVQNGVVVLLEGVCFSEGQEVTVLPIDKGQDVGETHGVMDIPPVSLGSVVRPMTANDDLLGEMLEGRREPAMAKQYQTEPLKIGAMVRIRNSGFGRGQIIEYRGTLGPNGARVYGIQRGKRSRSYIEVLEEQLEVDSAETASAAGDSHGGPAALGLPPDAALPPS